MNAISAKQAADGIAKLAELNKQQPTVKIMDLNGQKEAVIYMPSSYDGQKKEMKEFKKEVEQLTIESDCDAMESDRKERDADNAARSIRRSRTKIRRVCQRYKMRYMWTLTIALPTVQVVNPTNKKVSEFDAGNLQEVWKLWKLFLQRCRAAKLDFRYVCTVELQEDRLKNHGERVYHFHFATDSWLPVTRENAKRSGRKHYIQKLWSFGHVYATKNKSAKGMANNYLMKYIGKTFEDMGMTGAQRYRVSEGMPIPAERQMYKTFAEAIDAVVNMGAVLSAQTIEIDGGHDVYWFLIGEGQTG